jgi:hypothetical protein
MYRLAVVFKHTDPSYGSQFDIPHVNDIVHELIPKGMRVTYCDVLSPSSQALSRIQANGVLFVGLSQQWKEYIKLYGNSPELDIYVWANNQMDLVNNPDLFKNVKIRFEQSLRSHPNIPGKVFQLPTAYQDSKFPKSPLTNEHTYDVMFSGGINRSSRTIAPWYRDEILHGLLDRGWSIVNYNAIPETQKKVDEPCIKELIKRYPKTFKHIHRWALPEDYAHAKYLLNMPFPHLGVNAHKEWGMTYEERENIWYHTWDIFRAIGAQANIITFACQPIISLGLTSDQAHHYTATPPNTGIMIEQIHDILTEGKTLIPSEETMNDNSYKARWEFMFNQISKYRTHEDPRLR